MGRETFFIAKYNTTGAYGYKMLQNQSAICSNDNAPLPNEPIDNYSDTTRKQVVFTQPVFCFLCQKTLAASCKSPHLASQNRAVLYLDAEL